MTRIRTSRLQFRYSMNVSLIVAVARNGVIGKDNDLVWHLPDDMRYFKDTTKGHHVIMGRRNYESIPEKYRPLPGRTNVVVTRQDSYTSLGAEVVDSIEAGLRLAAESNDPTPFIIGGGQIYKAALEKDLVDTLHITWVDHEFDGDTFFPKLDLDAWNLVSETPHPVDEAHAYSYRICVYERKK